MLADVAIPPVTLEEVQHLSLSWLAVTVVAGVGAALLRWKTTSPVGPLLPPQRVRAAPWGPLAIFAAVSLYASALWLSLWLFGTFLSPFWAVIIAFPIQLVTLACFLRITVGAEPYQLGLTWHHWTKNVLLGYLLFVLVTPLTLGVFMGVQQLMHVSGGEQSTMHSVEKLLRENPSWSNWVATCLVAIVVQPIVEEIGFRGLIQTWLVNAPFAADLIMLVSLALAISLGLERDLRQFQLPQWWPVLFLLVVGPGYVLFERATWRWLRRPGAARAIFVSSLLFAAMHHDTWPTPIPLFVLAVALGWLAYRTQSIIACVVLHSLFNSVAMLGLVCKRV